MGSNTVPLVQGGTAPTGFEPVTLKLTASCTAVVLQGIVFLLKFEIQFVIPITHFSEDISVFIKTKFLGVLIRTF